jgi:PAS domain S-box-containing protein
MKIEVHHMRSDQENEYLLKAVDAFKRRIIVISPDYEILAANCPFEEASASDLVGKRCYHIFHERSSPCNNCAVEEAITKGVPTLMPKPDKSVDLSRVACYYAYPIFTDDKVEAIVSMDFDLPSVGKLEDKMQKSHSLLRNFILSAVDGVIAADKKGKILIFNEAASDVFGFKESEALNQVNIRDIYPDELELEVMRHLRSEDYGGKGKLRSYKVKVLNKQREEIPIRLNASIVYEGRKEVATIGFFHDMREKLRMQEELEKTQLQLLQAEKMASLGKLAAGVAHQLNNPLGGITLFTKIILEEHSLDATLQEDLHRILRDAERCRDTVKELLEFARQTRHFIKPQDINQAIERTLFLLENQTLFHNIQIEKDLDDKLPLVPADIQQLNHILMNIILNAAQAMEGNGRLNFRTALKANGEHVRIEIADTGPGIPEAIQARIFEPFFTTKEEGQGTGLGLSLVYGMVENHGGHIRAQSAVGKGTTFIIDLPLDTQGNEGDKRG